MKDSDFDGKSVSYGPFSDPAFHNIYVSQFDFDDTVKRLKAGLDAENLWLLHEIDPQAVLRRDNMVIPPARQLLFFHPRLMYRILTTCPDAIVEAPLKLVALQLSGGSVSVRHLDVADQFNRYAGLEELAIELADVYRRVLSHIA